MGLSLGICIISPFAITFLVSIILKLWHKAVNDDAPLPVVSRLFGSVFSILWSGSYLVLLLILIAMTPLRIAWYEKIQADVLASKTYTFIDGQISAKMPSSFLNMKSVTDILKDPNKLKAFESTEEFQALQEDERLKDLLSDEDLAEQVKNQDYQALLSNPKMQAVFRDKELLRKLFALNKRIAQENPEEEPEEDSGPKIIEIQPPEEP